MSVVHRKTHFDSYLKRLDLENDLTWYDFDPSLVEKDDAFFLNYFSIIMIFGFYSRSQKG